MTASTFILVPYNLFHSCSTVCHQAGCFLEKWRLDLWHHGSMSAIVQPKQEQYLFSMVAIPTYRVSVETLPCKKKKGPCWWRRKRRRRGRVTETRSKEWTDGHSVWCCVKVCYPVDVCFTLPPALERVQNQQWTGILTTKPASLARCFTLPLSNWDQRFYFELGFLHIINIFPFSLKLRCIKHIPGPPQKKRMKRMIKPAAMYGTQKPESCMKTILCTWRLLHFAI